MISLIINHDSSEVGIIYPDTCVYIYIHYIGEDNVYPIGEPGAPATHKLEEVLDCIPTVLPKARQLEVAAKPTIQAHLSLLDLSAIAWLEFLKSVCPMGFYFAVMATHIVLCHM